MAVFTFFILSDDIALIDGKPYGEGRHSLPLENGAHTLQITKTKIRTFGGCYLPLFAVVGVADESVTVSGGILVRITPTGFEVRYSMPFVASYVSPVVVLSKSCNYKGAAHVAALTRDSTYRLRVETDADSITYDTNRDLTACKLHLQPTNLGLLAVLSGISDKRNYLLIILYDATYRVLYEGASDGIEFSDNSFTVRENLRDTEGRVRHTRYTFSDGGIKRVERFFRYSDSHGYHPSLAPRLLLEAILAEDDEKAVGYLADDLKPLCSDLVKFIGAFTEFRDGGSEDEFYLYDVRECEGIYYPTKLKFVVTDGKVNNIDKL